MYLVTYLGDVWGAYEKWEDIPEKYRTTFENLEDGPSVDDNENNSYGLWRVECLGSLYYRHKMENLSDPTKDLTPIHAVKRL